MKILPSLLTTMFLLAMAGAILPSLPVAVAGSRAVTVLLHPATPAMAACLPTARASAIITPGPLNDSLTFHASGLLPLTGYDLLVTGSPHAPYGVAWPLSLVQTDAQGSIDTHAQAVLLGTYDAAGTSQVASPAAHLVLFFDDPHDAMQCTGGHASTLRVAGRLLGPAALITVTGPDGIGPLQRVAYQPPGFGISTPGGGRRSNSSPVIFTITCSDPEGWAAIRFIDFRLTERGTDVFMARLDRPARRLYVFDQARARWVGGLPPGGPGSLDTALARVVLHASNVLGSTGTTGHLLLMLSFTSRAAGRTFEQSVRVVDLRSQTRGWKASGSWRVD